MRDVLTIMEWIQEAKAGFRSLTEAIDTVSRPLVGSAWPGQNGRVLGMPLFKRLPVLCVPLRSGPQRGMPHEPTAIKSKFHAPGTAVHMSMPNEVAALIVEAASHPK